MKKRVLVLILTSLCGYMQSQVTNPGLMDTLSGEKLKSITVSGFVDVYYGSAPGTQGLDEMPFFVNMNKLDEITVNLAFLDLRYSTPSVRARLTPGFGTYMNANYASEPGTLKNLVEASAGIRPFRSKQIWIDAGVFGSPFTNESAISKDQLMYTRSLAPEYVPYYLAGVRVTMPVSSRLNLYMFLLNGWQQISNPDKNLSAALQLEYRPDSQNLINLNTYAGKDNSAGRAFAGMRYFADLYWIHNPEGTFSSTVNVYYGLQNTSPDVYRGWWQANVTGRYRFNSVISLSGRIEYFSDPDNIQVASKFKDGGSAPFRTAGLGACLNVNIHKNATFRFDARRLWAANAIFPDDAANNISHINWLVSGLTVWF